MNSQFFEVKVKGVREDENGKPKKVTVPLLIDATSVTEAEARADKEMEKTNLKDFQVKGAKQSNIGEVFYNENGGSWFKCKTTFVSLDEESGKEKKCNNYMLVEAGNVKEAYIYLEECLSDMIVPFEIPNITTSNIEDVFHYDANDYVPENLTPINKVASGVASGEYDSQGAEILEGDILWDEHSKMYGVFKKDDVFVVSEINENGESDPEINELSDFLENSGLELIKQNPVL